MGVRLGAPPETDYSAWDSTLLSDVTLCCTLFELEGGRPVGPCDRARYLYREGPLLALDVADLGVVVVDVSRCTCRSDWPTLPPGSVVAA